MLSERIQHRIDVFLDEADEAASAGEWQQVAEKARAVLAIDHDNEDAAAFLQMAVANGVSEEATPPAPSAAPAGSTGPARSVIEAAAIVEAAEAADAGLETRPEAEPESFAGGRYKVLHFLGEGGKKRVFLAHDALLDRDVAFSLIKTEGLDDEGRER